MNSQYKNMSKFQLNKRVALITGSTRGIGWEIAKGMAEAGASVYINGRVKEVLEGRCQDLCDLGYDAKPAFFDATDANVAYIDNEEVKQFVENRIPLKRWGNQKKLRALQYS